MKMLASVLFGIALCAIATTQQASAVDAPHVSTCATCHTSQFAPNAGGFNSNCLSCHSEGNAAAAKPFAVSSNGMNSHKWNGSDNVPAAGAQTPTTGALKLVQAYTGTGANSMSCVRCHDPHKNANGSFLRIDNSSDQLCLDCHRSRNVQDQTKGSHPVSINYDEAVLKNPAAFKEVPQNANPDNATSDLGARLAAQGGTILCSTCHSVHNSDSRSTTVDGFGNISTGDGFLLRTDTRGKKVAGNADDNLNVCTNCHAAKKNHNAMGQDVQCTDCHGAHVEYDAADPTSAPNVFLLRRTMPATAMKSGFSGNGRVYFQYTSAAKRAYINNDNTGVCQGCHTAPPSGNTHVGVTNNDCKSCHGHNASAGSFSPTGGCSNCHGFPPTTTSTGATHTTETNCNGCHNQFPGTHRNGTVEFSCTACHGQPPTTLKSGLSHPNNNSCSTCHNTSYSVHNNGTVNMIAAFASISSIQAAGISCGTCHGFPPITTHTGATHTTDTNCVACHDTSKHMDGAVQVNGCDSCHGYPPVPKNVAQAFGNPNEYLNARFEDYSGGGGAHLVAAHINPGAKASEGWANCKTCHNGGESASTPYHTMQLPLSSNINNVTVLVDPKLRFDNSFSVYTGAKLVSGANKTGSCFNISCHMSPSPKWSTER